MDSTNRILVVDDSSTMLSFMEAVCKEEGYDVCKAESGLQAIVELKRNHDFKAIVIDWMMPEMNGIDLLKKIKITEKWKNIPVIMQTSQKDPKSIQAGINAGAYYYLIKPYQTKVLTAIIKSALSDYKLYKKDQNFLCDFCIRPLMTSGEFNLKKIEEAHVIIDWMSSYSKKDNISIGLEELIKNSIEHGNLKIGYDDKSHYLENDTFDEEVERRQLFPENQDKFVNINYFIDGDMVKVKIKDMGEGFDYRQYLEFSPDRIFDLHGRGIAIANNHVFENLTYLNNGSEVVAEFSIDNNLPSYLIKPFSR
jgi:DNA-binding response OmpR family regulator